MKEFTQDIDVKDDEGNQLYEGTFKIKVKPRDQRLELSREFQKLVSMDDSERTEPYLKFSNQILKEQVTAVDIIHVPTGQKIESVDDFEYFNLEVIIAHIINVAVNGVMPGKKNAQP